MNGSSNECCICMTGYNPTNKAPVLCTACGNSICTSCCGNPLIGGAKSCPLCRAQNVNFVPNRGMIAMLEEAAAEQKKLKGKQNKGAAKAATGKGPAKSSTTTGGGAPPLPPAAAPQQSQITITPSKLIKHLKDNCSKKYPLNSCGDTLISGIDLGGVAAGHGVTYREACLYLISKTKSKSAAKADAFVLLSRCSLGAIKGPGGNSTVPSDLLKKALEEDTESAWAYNNLYLCSPSTGVTLNSGTKLSPNNLLANALHFAAKNKKVNLAVHILDNIKSKYFGSSSHNSQHIQLPSGAIVTDKGISLPESLLIDTRSGAPKSILVDLLEGSRAAGSGTAAVSSRIRDEECEYLLEAIKDTVKVTPDTMSGFRGLLPLTRTRNLHPKLLANNMSPCLFHACWELLVLAGNLRAAANPVVSSSSSPTSGPRRSTLSVAECNNYRAQALYYLSSCIGKSATITLPGPGRTPMTKRDLLLYAIDLDPTEYRSYNGLGIVLKNPQEKITLYDGRTFLGGSRELYAEAILLGGGVHDPRVKHCVTNLKAKLASGETYTLKDGSTISKS